MRAELIMKFGGTSLATAESMRRVSAHIRRETRSKLVVVSAVGGVTDLLLEAAAAARAGLDADPFVREVHRRHDEIVDKHGLTPDLITELHQEMSRLLTGVAMLRELSPRTRDAVVSIGERISTRLLSGVLNADGCPARAWDSWDLGLETDENHGQAEPLVRSSPDIRATVDAIDARLTPVVSGFIGRSTQGEITTLGRGGSDFSAALFGAALEVDEIQIWTDVQGILRADPRVVKDARVVPMISFEEAAELSFFGAKVLHPRTVEPAHHKNIPVRVLGTFHVQPDDPTPIASQGTVIDDRAPNETIRALAVRREVQSIHLHSMRMLEAPGFLASVFEILRKHRISVDVIATSEVSVSMTFDRTEGNLRAALEELSAIARVETAPVRSILCMVGTGLRDDTSVLARVFQRLAEHQVPVYVVTQGASRINITLVTDPEHTRVALEVLHQEFFPPS